MVWQNLRTLMPLSSILGALDKWSQFRSLQNLDREIVLFLLYCLGESTQAMPENRLKNRTRICAKIGLERPKRPGKGLKWSKSDQNRPKIGPKWVKRGYICLKLCGICWTTDSQTHISAPILRLKPENNRLLVLDFVEPRKDSHFSSHTQVKTWEYWQGNLISGPGGEIFNFSTLSSWCRFYADDCHGLPSIWVRYGKWLKVAAGGAPACNLQLLTDETCFDFTRACYQYPFYFTVNLKTLCTHLNEFDSAEIQNFFGTQIIRNFVNILHIRSVILI